MLRTSKIELFGPPQANNFEPLLVLTHPSPGVGGSPWKVLAIRPLRAFFLALSPYGLIPGFWARKVSGVSHFRGSWGLVIK